jgi:hypothetical protein
MLSEKAGLSGRDRPFLPRLGRRVTARLVRENAFPPLFSDILWPAKLAISEITLDQCRSDSGQALATAREAW